MRRAGVVAISIGALALLGSSCAPRAQRFVPTERATARTAAGFTAAQYDLWGPQGNLGEVTVWSRGAYAGEVGEARATVIEVSFGLTSLGAAPIVLTEVALDGVMRDGQRAEGLRPVRVEGLGRVGPGEERVVRMFFTLPPQQRPREIHGFRVRWQLLVGDEIVYRQRTPFVQSNPPRYVYTPYYDPFWGPGFWGPGWGPGFWGPGFWGPRWGWGGGVWIQPRPFPMRHELRPSELGPSALDLERALDDEVVPLNGELAAGRALPRAPV